MSKSLLAFLKSWLEWAENGAIQAQPHSRYRGLCTNLAHSQFRSAYMELLDMFESQCLNPIYPFDCKEFIVGTNAGTMHLNPMRLAWVREQIAKAEGR